MSRNSQGEGAAQVAADARIEETGVLRRTIGAGRTGRLFDVVDKYLREDGPR
jgi:hypothetical protein